MLAGETTIEVPEPARVPPQLPVYHLHDVALFNVPVLMLSVVLTVPQLTVEEAISVGVVGLVHGISLAPKSGFKVRAIPQISIVGAVKLAPDDVPAFNAILPGNW